MYRMLGQNCLKSETHENHAMFAHGLSAGIAQVYDVYFTMKWVRRGPLVTQSDTGANEIERPIYMKKENDENI